MNPQVKEKWIDALRSGKYEQGSEKLRGVNGYCCLGVLCDLYSQEQNTEWQFRGYDENTNQTTDYWYFEEQSEFLPESVKEWAGLPACNPNVKVDVTGDDDEEDWFYFDEIASLNDSGYSFIQLSEIIQEQF